MDSVLTREEYPSVVLVFAYERGSHTVDVCGLRDC